MKELSRELEKSVFCVKEIKNYFEETEPKDWIINEPVIEKLFECTLLSIKNSS